MNGLGDKGLDETVHTVLILVNGFSIQKMVKAQGHSPACEKNTSR